jgi:hypothetical protein
MHGDGGSLTRTSSERLTSLLTVAGDLPKRRSAQRGAGPYSHGGVLTRRRRALRFEDVQQRRAHYLTVYGCQRPAETPVRTAVSARFMVRKNSGLFSSSVDQQEQPLVQVNAYRSIWIK